MLKRNESKKYKKKTMQRRSSDHRTCNKSSQEPNHSGLSSVTTEISSCSGTDGEVYDQLPKKPKVLWPAANEKGKYKCLEEEVCKKVYNMKATTEVKLKKLASSIYMAGEELFGVVNSKSKK